MKAKTIFLVLFCLVVIFQPHLMAIRGVMFLIKIMQDFWVVRGTYHSY